MGLTELVLIFVIGILASSLAAPLSRRLRDLDFRGRSSGGFFVMLLGITFLEGSALVASMLSPVIPLILALVWGVMLARILSRDALAGAYESTVLRFALYTCIPAFSFIVLPLLLYAQGWDILDGEAGRSFGVPQFLPGPLETILGFYLLVSLGIPLLKTGVSTFTAMGLRNWGKGESS